MCKKVVNLTQFNITTSACKWESLNEAININMTVPWLIQLS